MSSKHVSGTLAVAILLSAAIAATAAPGDTSGAFVAGSAAAGRLRIIHKPSLISIGLDDFDLLKARFRALKGEFVFMDAKGGQIASYEFDYTLPVARSHVLFKKMAGAEYATVSIKLTDGKAALFQKKLVLPPVVAAASVAAGKENAIAYGGSSKEPIPAALQALKLPDYAKVAEATLGKAGRVLTSADVYKQVRCTINYPVPGSSDHGLLQRQTANPDDLTRKSIYVSLRSPLYDPKTGAFVKYEKFLVEFMLEKEWLLPPLQAEGDVDVAIPIKYMRVHSTAEAVPSRHFLRNISITGDMSGGLMQSQNSYTRDDDGNLYFSIGYRGVSRLNIRTRKWESTPVDIWSGAGETVRGPHFDKYHPFMEAILPKLEDVPYGKTKPYGKKVVSRRLMDGGCKPYHHNGRIYLSFTSNGIFKAGTTLYFAMVMSIPTKHWDDADAFLKDIKIHAVSWPTGKFPLWDTWVKEGEQDRKLHRMSADPNGKRLYMLCYNNKYFWALDLDDEGNTRRLTRLDTFNGKPIEKFPRFPKFLTDGKKSLGAVVTIKLKGEEKPRDVFLPVDGTAFTDQIPKTARTYRWGYKHIGNIGGETQYGTKTIPKGRLANWAGWRGQGIKGGKLTIYYDAIAAMLAEGDRHKHILDRIGGVSLAPVYHLAPIPCEPGRVIGISERGYDQAYYDTSTADKGYVTKSTVLRDIPGIESTLAAGTVMGPYAHRWLQEGNRLSLYYVGYHNGIARMLYAVDGKPLGRYNVEQLARRLPRTSADGATPGKIMRMRHLNYGLNGKMYFTGTDWANRGGTPYSGGLVYFDVNKLDARHRLSKMSRSYGTAQIAWRVLVGEGGERAQEIYLGGSFDKDYAAMLPTELVPPTKGPKIFAYGDSPAKGVHDRFAMDLMPRELVEEKGRFQSIAFSRDQLHMLVLYGKWGDTYLASIDMTTGAFADVKHVKNAIMNFIKPDTFFIDVPDGRLMFYAWDNDEDASASFTEVVTGPDGQITFHPHVTLTGKDRKEVRSEVPMGFVADPSGDGSYDLMLGTWGAVGGRPETRLRLIKDFVPPRPQAVAKLGTP